MNAGELTMVDATSLDGTDQSYTCIGTIYKVAICTNLSTTRISGMQTAGDSLGPLGGKTTNEHHIWLLIESQKLN